MDKIGGLMLGGHPPDMMVELLLPFLWLENAVGYPTNMCVVSCATLQAAYATLGIAADPVAVVLVVDNQATGEQTVYGRPDPFWTGNVYSGHCALTVRGSGRFIDPTVEQYPELRPYRLGPICGRTVATAGGSAEQRAQLASGALVPGMRVAVQRQNLMLLYTVLGPQADATLWAGGPLVEHPDELTRGGENLAAQAVLTMRKAGVAHRVPAATYPRLRALLDVLADAEISPTTDRDIRFILPGDPHRAPRRLSEIPTD